jgi:hypothetical protein
MEFQKTLGDFQKSMGLQAKYGYGSLGPRNCD